MHVTEEKHWHYMYRDGLSLSLSQENRSHTIAQQLRYAMPRRLPKESGSELNRLFCARSNLHPVRWKLSAKH